MASKFIRFITVLATLAIPLAWGVPPTPAHAASLADSLTAKSHRFKFYLDPALVPDLSFAKAVLPKYVADMNTILAKNTDRQLVFDPDNDIIKIDYPPQTDWGPTPLPTEGFEIWAYITKDTPTPYDGRASLDQSGAGVLTDLHWTQIYDPDALTATQVLDYRRQINIMLHEMAHMFGAGIGEYYSLNSITDTTDVAPLLNINRFVVGDPYWSDKQDFMNDPLLGGPSSVATRADYLLKARYSNLTAAVISGDYRNGVPSFQSFTVQVLDEAGQPIAGAEVKVWNVVAGSLYTSTLLYDITTDDNGQAALPWGGTGSSHYAGNMLRLIKVYLNGQPFTPARYVSIFDADIAQLVNGQSAFTVTMQPPNQPPTNVTLSNASIDENKPAGTLVGELGAVDADKGETFTFRFCGGTGASAFQITGSQLLSAAKLDYELQKSYSVCLKVDDGRGGTFNKTVTIRVNDLPDTTTVPFLSQGVNDGWVLESGKGSNTGGSSNASNGNFLIGNDASNRRYRSVLSFKTDSLPDNAIITRVALKVRKQGQTTTDPFATLGNLLVDGGEPLLGTLVLQNTDFQVKALSSVGVFGKKPDANGWYTATLSSSAFSLVNLTGATQFRLRFSKTSNTGLDYLALFSGNAALAVNRPVLMIQYELP